MPMRENQNQVNDSNATGQGRVVAADKQAIRTAQAGVKRGEDDKAKPLEHKARPEPRPKEPPKDAATDAPDAAEGSGGEELRPMGLPLIDLAAQRKTRYLDNLAAGAGEDWMVQARDDKYSLAGDENRPLDWAAVGREEKLVYHRERDVAGDTGAKTEPDMFDNMADGVKEQYNRFANALEKLSGWELERLDSNPANQSLMRSLWATGMPNWFAIPVVVGAAKGAAAGAWGGPVGAAAGAATGLALYGLHMFTQSGTDNPAEVENALAVAAQTLGKEEAAKRFSTAPDQEAWDKAGSLERLVRVTVAEGSNIALLFGASKVAKAAGKGVIATGRKVTTGKWKKPAPTVDKSKLNKAEMERLKEIQTLDAAERAEAMRRAGINQQNKGNIFNTVAEAELYQAQLKAMGKSARNFTQLKKTREQLIGTVDEVPPLPSMSLPDTHAKVRRLQKRLGKTDDPEEIAKISREVRETVSDASLTKEFLHGGTTRPKEKLIPQVEKQLQKGLEKETRSMNEQWFVSEFDLRRRAAMLPDGATRSALTEAANDTQAFRELLLSRSGKNLGHQAALTENHNTLTKMLEELEDYSRRARDAVKPGERRKWQARVDKTEDELDTAIRELGKPGTATDVSTALLLSAYKDNLLSRGAFWNAGTGTVFNYSLEMARELMLYPRDGLRSMAWFIPRGLAYIPQRLFSSKAWKDSWKHMTRGHSEWRYSVGEIADETSPVLKAGMAASNLNAVLMGELDGLMSYAFKTTSMNFAMRETLRSMIRRGAGPKEISQLRRQMIKGDMSNIPADLTMNYVRAADDFHRINQFRLPQLVDNRYVTGLQPTMLSQMGEFVHQTGEALRKHDQAAVRATGMTVSMFSKVAMNAFDQASRWTPLGIMSDLAVLRPRRAFQRLSKDKARIAIGSYVGYDLGMRSYHSSPFYNPGTDSSVEIGKSGMPMTVITPFGRVPLKQLGGIGLFSQFVHQTAAAYERMKAMGDNAGAMDYIDEVMTPSVQALLQDTWFNMGLAGFMNWMRDPDKYDLERIVSNFVPGVGFAKRVHGAVTGEYPSNRYLSDLFAVFRGEAGRYIRPHYNMFGRTSAVRFDPTMAGEYEGQHWEDWVQGAYRFLNPKAAGNKYEAQVHNFVGLMLRTGGYTTQKKVYLRTAGGGVRAFDIASMPAPYRRAFAAKLARPSRAVTKQSSSGIVGKKLDYGDWNESQVFVSLRKDKIDKVLDSWALRLADLETGETHVQAAETRLQTAPAAEKQKALADLRETRARAAKARSELQRIMRQMEIWRETGEPIKRYRERWRGIISAKTLNNPKADTWDFMMDIMKLRSFADLKKGKRGQLLRDRLRDNMAIYKHAAGAFALSDKESARFAWDMAKAEVVKLIHRDAVNGLQGQGMHQMGIGFAPSAVQQHLDDIMEGSR